MDVRLGVTLVWALASAAMAGAPEPVKPVEVARYAGRWFEIARYPNLFERGADCSAPTAEFGGESAAALTVVQTCHKGSPDGPVRTYRASGRVIDPPVNARLRLTYFLVIRRDYWVLDHADDYRWAILGDPAGRYLWVLARTPLLVGGSREEAMQRVKALGYDPARLEFPAQ